MKSKEKGVGLHPRNIHQGRYDLAALVGTLPELSQIIFDNDYGQQSLDFANPIAVKLLNKALLLHYYELSYWDIPEGYLCPPIPGRADYLHHIADLLARDHGKKIPLGEGTHILDLGVGANLIYPILGTSLFEWDFVGTEIDLKALSNAAALIAANPRLEGKISLRYQADAQLIFDSVIEAGDFFEACLCNPPFHESAEVAREGSKRKIKNLKGLTPANPVLNFGGQATELSTLGGELGFIGRMIQESVSIQEQVGWFTVLVSKGTHLSYFQGLLDKAGVKSQRIIEMGQGNKRSRILAWSFLR
jgi:23S rRNA (adenine1618-N6)-methyltransferase